MAFRRPWSTLVRVEKARVFEAPHVRCRGTRVTLEQQLPREGSLQDLDPPKYLNKLFVRIRPGEPLPELRLPFSGRVSLVGPGGAPQRGPKAQLCQ